MLFQAGAPVTADLFGPALAGQTVLLPKTLHAFAADAKTPANFAGAFPALPRSDDPLSQILTQRPHNFPFMKGRIAGFTRYVYLNRKCSSLRDWRRSQIQFSQPQPREPDASKSRTGFFAEHGGGFGFPAVS